jgi:tetratricopeptide (TPR) repeat protein
MLSRRALALALAITSLSRAACADPLAYFALRGDAQTLYAKKDFAAAAPKYQQLAEANPDYGENWLRLARCRMQLKEYQPAIAAYGRANALGAGRLQQNYVDIARAHASLGEKGPALEWLRKALYEQRFEFRPSLRDDPAFANLRESERFRELAGLLPKREFTRDEGWRYDVDYLVGEIKRLNTVYSRAPFPDEFQKAVTKLRERVPALTDGAIAVEMQRLLALLANSHNNLFGSAEGGRVSFTRLPVTFYLFPDGPYIIDGEGEFKRLAGSRVVRFDDAQAEKVVAAAAALMRRENDVEGRWLAPGMLASPQALHALGLTAHPDRLRLTVSRGGLDETIELKAGQFARQRKLIPSQIPGAPPAPMYLGRAADEYWFKPLPAEQAVFCQFNQVVDKKDESLADFAKRLRKSLDENRVRNLIVDLRHNNGGNTYLYPELVRTLVHFDAGGDDRKFYVLIGRGTYSAAMNFGIDVERFTRAVFVGEPTGGKPNSHGDESPTVLPYSGLNFLLSCVYWQLASPRDTRLFITPSIPVTLTAEDYFANRDPALDAILRLIRKPATR